MNRSGGYCTCFLLLLVQSLASAQYWGNVGTGLPYEVHTLYPDSGFDRLLAGTRSRWAFNASDSVEVMGIAAWDGERFDSLAHRIQTTNISFQNIMSPIDRFMRYHGQLYASGGFGLVLTDSTFLGSNARLNETTLQWEPLECDFTGGITQMLTMVADTLYFTGYMDPFCGIFQETCVVQYDGGTFHPFDPFLDLPYYSGNYTGSVVMFQGQYYMSGLFTVDTVDVEFYGLMRHNGSAWEPVPGFETAAPIKKLMVHEDKLYVAGNFRELNGAPGNCIAVFNGNTWDDLGGGLLMDLTNPGAAYPLVWDMLFMQDDLIVVGNFNYAGDAIASNIAKWTGDRWCSFAGQFDQSILSATVWRDTLYIGGSFSSIDGAPYNYLARWEGGEHSDECSTPVGIQDDVFKVPSIIPISNGAGRWLVPFTDQAQGAELFIYDMAGRSLHGLYHHDPLGFQLDLTSCSPGLYLLHIVTKQGKVHAIKLLMQ